MGWSSGGEIFDPVARALIECGADDVTKRRVLGELIDRLQDGDWDTEDESVEQFRDDPLIVRLFMERGVGVRTEAQGADRTVSVDWKRDHWVIRCCPSFLESRPGTVEGHDDLVRAFYVHDAQAHGGDGRVPHHMLINQD